MHGFTKNYIRVELSAKDADPKFDNQLINVKLGEMTRDPFAGKERLLPFSKTSLHLLYLNSS